MNLALNDPFGLAQDYPENQNKTLKSGHVTCVRFNRRGDFLAAGRTDGKVVIFDMDVQSIARKLKGHTRQIQSLSWSRCGRFLLSSAVDWKVNLWDLATGEAIRMVRFDGPLLIAELHPYNHFEFAACRFDDQPVQVNISNPIPTMKRLPTMPRRIPGTASDSEIEIAKDTKAITIVALYTASGKHILSATTRGWINVIDSTTLEIIYSYRVSLGAIISFRFTNSGKDIVVNSSDRVIRTFVLPNLEADPDTISFEVEHKFQDVVNKLSWNYVNFSATGDYVMASTYNNHDIYIWERAGGTLVKILEGPKEEHGLIEWHPHRPMVVAVALESGRCHIWSIEPQQKWSALAPDFAEVNENVEYMEAEDEFDIYPKEELDKRRLDQEEDDVDIWTVQPIEGEEESFNLPLLSDVSDSGSDDELVPIGRGEMRRKSPGSGRDFALEGDGDGELNGRKKAVKKRR